MKRPMLYWVISFVLGEVLTGRIPKTGMVILSLIFGILIVKGRQAYIEKNRKLLFFGVLFFLFGFINCLFWNKKTEICVYPEKTNVFFRGRVVEKEGDNEKYIYRVNCTVLGEDIVKTGIIVEMKEEIILGSVIEGYGEYKELLTATNPGQFDEKTYRYSMGIMAKLKDIKLTGIKYPVFGVREKLYRMRITLSEILSAYIDEKNISVARAMLLGEKTDMDKDIKALYQRNGIAHLLAISGLHIAMLGGSLYHLLRRMSGSFLFASVIGIIFILLYGLMTGLSGATLRAVIMLGLALGADVLGRKYDAMTGLSIALLLMLIRNPLQINQAGFLLSFGAVIGITCIYPVLNEQIKKALTENRLANKKKRKRKSILERLVDGLLISVSVQLVTIPVMLYFFYEIPVYSVFLNLIVVPLMSILLGGLIIVEIAGELSVLFSSTGLGFFVALGKGLHIIAGGAGYVSDIIFNVYERLCEINERIPYHMVCTGRPLKEWIILYYVFLAISVSLLYMKKYKSFLAAFTLLCILWTVFLIPGSLKVCIFDVGQGDGIFIKLPDGDGMLIDGGSSSKKNVGTYIIKNGMKYYGSNHLLYSVVTHADSDHYSGVIELMEDPDVMIDNFILPYILNPDEGYIKLVEAAKKKGCNIIYIKNGDRIVVGDVTFMCLNPEKQEYEDKNTGSIVLWMNYKDFDMIFTGDMDIAAEKRVMNNDYLCNAIENGCNFEMLKVAHHGSATSTSDEFLTMFKFDDAIVSVGEKNRYGHPAPEVMERLDSHGCRAYRTDRSGCVTVEVSGKKVDISEFCDD